MKTRAGLFWEVGQPLEVAEIDLAEPGPDDVVVRMAAVGICGTDLHQVKGEFQRPVPMVLGHEGAGVVETVGDAVEHLSVGDEVVLSWAPSCGECAGCKRGRPATCIQLNRAIGAGTLPDGSTGMSLGGETVYRGTATGCWAERVVVSSQVALPLNGAVPLDQAALLGCAALTGVGAVLFAAEVTPGSSVVVVGAGGVGQFIVQGARLAGADVVVVSDPVEARLEQVIGLGATHAVAPDALKATMKQHVPDGADFGFDAVGDPATTASALRFTRNGGRTVMVGLPAAGARLDLDPGEFLRKEKWLTGTLYGSEDPAIALPIVLEHVAAGQLKLAELLGPRFSLDDLNEAVETSLAGSAGRVLVTP